MPAIKCYCPAQAAVALLQWNLACVTSRRLQLVAARPEHSAADGDVCMRALVAGGRGMSLRWARPR